MDERQRRLWAGTEAGAIGFGGVATVARATGLAISTVRKGRDEARAGAKPGDVVRVRRSAGKRPFEEMHPEVWPVLEKLVNPATRGDPESPLRWTCKSTQILAGELFAQHGIRISDRTVAKLLRDHGYSLQAPKVSSQHYCVRVEFCQVGYFCDASRDTRGTAGASVRWRVRSRAAR